MRDAIAVFDGNEIRRVYDEHNDVWYFSVVDIIGALTEQPDARGATLYWGTLKRRLKEEGSEVLTNCQQLKLPARDGKKYKTDCATADTILRIVQSVPSPKAEPIKMWLAQTGSERLQEEANPELAVDRARATWERHGRSKAWIEQRILGQQVRSDLTSYWASHNIPSGSAYGILTDATHKGWTGMSVKEHKALKGLSSQNLRDHMTITELVLTSLAEVSTKQIAEETGADGFQENYKAACEGGNVARQARAALEAQTGKSVVTSDSHNSLQ